MAEPGFELATTGSDVRCATDCAVEPGWVGRQTEVLTYIP